MNRDDPGKDLDVKTPKILLFLQSNLFFVIAGIILLFAVAGSIYGVFFLGESAAEDRQTAEESAEGEASEGLQEAEILPQQRREDSDYQYEEDGEYLDEDAWDGFDASIDPFADPMKLTGTVTGGRGGAMAIIESSGTSYIVAEGDYVDDLWAVSEVGAEKAVLRAHDKEVTLYLDQPPETRPIGGAVDEDGQEEDD